MSKAPILLCFIVLSLGVLVHCSVENNKLRFYEIKKGDFSMKVTNFGARIVSVVLPDKHGKLADIVLGYDTIKEYKNDTSEFGAIVGRVANRISGAKFTLNGTVYKLEANDGPNTLHGGKKGFSYVAWKVKRYKKDGSITLTYHSFDGEGGFPGDVLVHVTYTLLKPYRLSVTMEAKALNKATPINLAQHTYWNLGGHTSGNILSNELQIFGSKITPLDSQLIPTGEIIPITKTPYDFRAPKVIKDLMKGLPEGSVGYNINYAVDGEERKMRRIAAVRDKKSGRVMKLYANQPGVQFYTSNHIHNVKGKGGYVYKSHPALCLETQGFPDAVNHRNFPSQIVEAGQVYYHKMLFEFSVEK